MATLQVRFEKRSSKKRTKLQQIAHDIQHAITEIEGGVSSLEDAISELPSAQEEQNDTAEKFLEELGLSATKRYSLVDVERLKIAVKWALEGE